MSKEVDDTLIEEWIYWLAKWRTEEEIQEKEVDIELLREIGYEIEEREELERIKTIVLKPRRGTRVFVGRRVGTLNLNRIWKCVSLYATTKTEITDVEIVEEIIAPLERKETTVTKYSRELAKRFPKCSERDWREVFKLRSAFRKRFAPRFREIEAVLFRGVETEEETLVMYYRAPLVDIVQFLGSYCVKYEHLDSAKKRVIEARGLVECKITDFPHAIHELQRILYTYLELLGYDELLESSESSFGYSDPLERFEKPQTHKFTAYFEVFDYSRKRVAHKHLFKNVKLFWVNDGSLETALIKDVSYESGQFEELHIFADKGIDPPTELIVNDKLKSFHQDKAFCADGAGLTSSTMSDIVPQIVVNQRLGLDVDSLTREFHKLQKFFNLSYISARVAVFESSSGNGFHFVSNLPTRVDPRLALKDCKGRIFCSEVRSRPLPIWDDVLFAGKTDSRNKLKYRHELVPEQLLSLPFWSKVPRGFYKNRRGGYRG